MIFNQNSYIKYRATLVIGGLCLLLSGFTAHAYSVVDGSSLRVFASNPDSASASYQVRDTMKIEPDSVIVLTGNVPTPPAVVSTGGSSGADSGGKYDASEWLLGRVYDKLVRERGESEPFLASAPEQTRVHREDPVLVLDETVLESDVDPLVDYPKPEETNEVTLEPVEEGPIDNIVPKLPTPRVIITKVEKPKLTFDDMGDVDGSFKMSAPEESLLDESGNDHRYCLTRYIVDDYDIWKPIAYRLMFFIVGLVLVIYLLVVLLVLMIIRERREEKKRKKTNTHWLKQLKKAILGSLFIGVSFGLTALDSQAATTTPQIFIYEGQLFDDTGNALTGDYTFRFSFWDNVDFEASDVVAGVLDTGAADYRGWNEVQTETLVTEGRFSFEVGTVTPFVANMFDQDNLYLQVEVKEASQADSFYELIDIDGSDDNVDRKIIATVPFALNANKLDYRDVGFGPGEIPYINETTGKLDSSIVDASPTGTDENSFILDEDGNAAAADNLVLQFGSALGKTLLWNSLLDQFEFNDDVNIDGNLVVTGTINGVTLGPVDYEHVLSPRYDKSILEGDGSDNRGSMYEEVESVLGLNKQILRWDTKQASMQDYDILIRYQLPRNFKEFKVGNGLVVEYRTTGTATDAQIDITLEKEGLAGDFISSTGLNLNNTGWVSQDFDIAAGGGFVANDIIWVKMKMQAVTGFEAAVADVKFNMVLE